MHARQERSERVGVSGRGHRGAVTGEEHQHEHCTKRVAKMNANTTDTLTLPKQRAFHLSHP